MRPGWQGKRTSHNDPNKFAAIVCQQPINTIQRDGVPVYQEMEFLNMLKFNSVKSFTAAAVLVAASVSLPGCYKAEAEANRTKAEQFDNENKQLKAELDKAHAETQAAMRRAQAAEGQLAAGVLVTMVDGQEVGRDTLRWDGSKFVRNGPRSRANGTVNFDNGRVADGPMSANRDNGKVWFRGQTRNSRPDGEWIWYDRDGKEQTKEVWTEGKLADVYRASVAKDGKVTWSKLAKAERDTWARSTANTFVNLPELVRDVNAASSVQAAKTDATAEKPKTGKPTTKKSGSQANADSH